MGWSGTGQGKDPIPNVRSGHLKESLPWLLRVQQVQTTITTFTGGRGRWRVGREGCLERVVILVRKGRVFQGEGVVSLNGKKGGVLMW